MKTFLVKHTGCAVYTYLVKAENKEDAEEKYLQGEWEGCDDPEYTDEIDFEGDGIEVEEMELGQISTYQRD
jgi:hypothetical protein